MSDCGGGEFKGGGEVPAAGAVEVQDEGTTVVSLATCLDFAGQGVLVTDQGDGKALVTIPGGGAGNTIITQDEGAVVDPAATTLNFVGAGVTAANAGGGVTNVTIPGGAGGSRSFILFGAQGVASSGTIRYLYPGFANTIAQTPPIQVLTPAGVSFSAFRIAVLHNNPDGNGNDITYTLRKNGAATALVVTMASTDVSGETTATVAFVAGDRFDIEVTKPGGNIGNSPNDIILLLEVG